MNTNLVAHRRNRKRNVIITIILSFFVLLTLYPILFVILTSFKTSSDFYTNIWFLPRQFAWSNYTYAWTVGKIGIYFKNSVIIVSISVVATLVMGSMAGYALSKLSVPHANLITLAIFLLSMLPSESILMPMYITISKMKITGTFPALILPFIGWGLPLTIYIYRNFFATIPVEIMEASRIDGCNEATTFTRVVMPVMLPATATNAIFLFLGWWGEMLWSSVELSSSSLKTLPMGVTAFVQSFGTDWGPMCAASCIVLVPVILFFLFAQKYILAGLSAGAVKG